MDVIILAGGLGTRLRSVVQDIPKCMAPVAGNPFLFYILDYLSKQAFLFQDGIGNIERVILSVGYKKDIIVRWLDARKNDYPFAIDYAVEESPLGTGGAIKLAMEKCDSNDVLVLNGDTFFDVDLRVLYKEHYMYPTHSITLALKPMTKFERYGTVVLDEVNEVIAFREKSYCENGMINGGMYLINKNLLDLSEMPQKFSFEKDIFEKLIAGGNIYGCMMDRYFIDIGVPEDYRKANVDFLQTWGDEFTRY